MDTSGHMEKLRRYIGKGKVFIFSASYCPYCVKVKNLFKNLGVKYESVEVDKSNDFPDNFIEFLEQHAKIDTYPKVYIGEECVGGCDDTEKLFNNMKLFEKFKAEGIEYEDA